MSSDNPDVVKNSLFSVLQIVATSLCFVIIYYLIIRKLGKAELGAWSIITSLPVAISVFGSGVSGCVLRYVPIYAANRNRKAFNEIIFSGLIFNAVLGGILIFAGYLFSTQILQFLFSRTDLPHHYLSIFNLALVICYMNFVSSVLLYAMDGLQLIHVRNKIMIAGSSTLCISAALLISYFDLIGVVYAQFLQSALITLLVAITLSKNKLFEFKNFRVKKFYIRLFLTYGQGFQVMSLCILLFEPVTKYFLNKYFNLSVVGIYDIVNRIVIQVRTLVVSAIQVIIPMVSKGNEQGTLDIGSVYQKTNRGASLLSYCLYGTLLTLSMFAVRLVDPSHIKTYLFMALFMAVASHFNIITSTAYSMLMGLGKLKDLVISHLISTGLNVVLYLTLRNFLTDSLIVLPVSLSITISSLYLMYNFRKEFQLSRTQLSSSDLRIQSLSIASMLMAIILVLVNTSAYYFFALFIIQGLAMLYLIFYNDFFQGLIRKIFNLK